MGIPNFKERREYIAEEVKNHLLDGGTVSRLARHLYWGRDQKKLVSHFCLGIYMNLRNTFVHQWGFNEPHKNLEMIQAELAKAWDTVRCEDEVDPYEFRTFSSPPTLEGLFEPEVSGRSDIVVPSDVRTAMQHMTNTPLRIDTACWEVFCQYRTWLYATGQEHLDREVHVPFALHTDNDESERLIRYHEKVETDRIADHKSFNIVFNTGDEVCRIYGKKGYGPTFSKRLRACTRCAEARPLSKELESRWISKMREEHRIVGDMDKWAEACASLAFLQKTGDYEQVGHAFGWLSYRKTGLCDVMIEIDAPASGFGHIRAQNGSRGDQLERCVNMAHHSYVHPYEVLTNDLMRNANIGLRVAPDGVTRDEFVRMIVKQVAKPAMVPGQYGGGAVAMAGSALGLEYTYCPKTNRLIWDYKFRWVDSDGNTYSDWEAEKRGEGHGILKDGSRTPVKWVQTAFPNVPPLFAARFEGKTDDQICEGMVKIFKKVSISLKRVFPDLPKLNERSIFEWSTAMGEDGLELPPVISNVGYEFQPSPFRKDRGQFRRISYRIDGGDKVELNHIQRYSLAHSETSYLAKRTIAKDATVKRGQYVIIAPTGMPSIGIHDADFFPVWAWDIVHGAYVTAFEDTYPGLKFSPNAKMLR
jgi:hypothetical protein